VPNYEQYIKQFLELFSDLVRSQSRSGLPNWVVSLISTSAGVLLGFVVGWARDLMKEQRDNAALKEALYQEIAYNYEALMYWISPERVNFEWLKDNLYREITFFAYEGASKNASALYGMPEHGWFIAVFRELKKLCEQGHDADDTQLFDLLKSAVATIESCDPDRPQTKELLRTKLGEQFRQNIR
jgi:hypothetical protein